MEVHHCAFHLKRLAEYMCPSCKNLPLCKTCKLKHEAETRHAPENCKEVGLAIMRQRIQDAGGKQVNELAKGLRKALKELEAGFLREIDKFQSSCMQTEELRKMKKLNSERRYAELYLYTKSLHVGGVKNKAATGELNKRLLEMIDTTSDELKKVVSNIVAAKQHKPVFAAYKSDEVLTLKGKSCGDEERVISALHIADMAKFKAIYIAPLADIGDRVVSELAFRLQQAHPVSALYLADNDISDSGVELLAQAAFRGKSLSVFCIAGSKISDAGAKAMAKAARNCHSLTTFYLNGWRISDSGAKAVAEAVKGCPLSVFYLMGCRISDSGATAVAEAMKGRSLSTFCLGSNEMSDAGAITVAKATKDCPLSMFYLGGNNISDSGATTVVKTLSNGECASTLSAFCLCGSGISDSGAKKAADAARGCPQLSEFCLDGKPISGETLAYVLESMTGIKTIRSVNLRIGEISKEQMDYCLDQLEQIGVERRFKLRFQCDTEAAKSVCNKFAAEWNPRLAEFRIVPSIANLFVDDLILGVPK